MQTPPVFLETSPAVLVADLVSAYEASTGKTLYPAQIERLWVDVLAYRESLVRQGIQTAAEQNLVDFATGARLEGLARLVGVSRLAARKAACQWRITLAAPDGSPTVYPAGRQAVSPNGAIWQTTESATIPAGQLTVDVPAEAVEAGEFQNDIPPGSTFTLLEGAASVVSLTGSSGGAEAETDEQLRARALLAPFGFSAAGSSGAYRYHAMSASPLIIDVAVSTPTGGTVAVYPLTSGGLPTQEVLDVVQAALDADTVRPLCDAVVVASPVRVAFAVEANLTIYATADEAVVEATARASVEAYLADRRAGLGRDLIASQIIKSLGVEGVYKVELVGWVDRVLAASEWADGVAALHLVGSAHG